MTNPMHRTKWRQTSSLISMTPLGLHAVSRADFACYCNPQPTAHGAMLPNTWFVTCTVEVVLPWQRIVSVLFQATMGVC